MTTIVPLSWTAAMLITTNVFEHKGSVTHRPPKSSSLSGMAPLIFGDGLMVGCPPMIYIQYLKMISAFPLPGPPNPSSIVCIEGAQMRALSPAWIILGMTLSSLLVLEVRSQGLQHTFREMVCGPSWPRKRPVRSSQQHQKPQPEVPAGCLSHRPRPSTTKAIFLLR